jgi:hypothetical protein
MVAILSGCTSRAQTNDPALPRGFDPTSIPDVELRGYVYVALPQHAALPLRAFGIGDAEDREMMVRRLEGIVNEPGGDFGLIVSFAEPDDAEQVRELIEQHSDGSLRNLERKDEQLLLARGVGDWPNQLQQAWSANRRASLEERYSDAYETMRLLLSEPPATPVAVGFARDTADVLEYVLQSQAITIPGLSGAMEFIRVGSAAFVAYSDDPDKLPHELSEVTLRDSGLSVIAVARAGYPGIIVNLLLGTFAGHIGLEEVEIGGHQVRYRSLEGKAHLMAINFGAVIFFGLSATRNGTERLIQAVIDNQD